MAAAVASVLLAGPYLVLFLFFKGGAGDVKLTAALGAWLGPAEGVWLLFFIALCGAAHATAILMLRIGRPRKVMLATESRAADPLIAPVTPGEEEGAVSNELTQSPAHKQTMPYGPAIFAGVCIWSIGVLLWGT